MAHSTPGPVDPTLRSLVEKAKVKVPSPSRLHGLRALMLLGVRCNKSGGAPSLTGAFSGKGGKPQMSMYGLKPL